MKVLMIVPGMDKRLGGTTTVSIGFFTHLNTFLEVSIAAIYLNEDERKAITPEYFNLDTVHLFKSELSFYKYARSFKSFLKQHIEDYDLVHIHGLWHGASYVAASAALKAGIPYVISPHGMLEPDAFARSGWKKSIFWKLLYASVYKNASAIHCIAKAEMINAYSFDKEANVFYVPNGINVPVLFKVKRTKNRMLFMGRLHEKKGVDLLMRAIVSFPHLNLIIAGTGAPAYESYLHELAKELNKKQQIAFVGFVDGEQKEKLYQESLFCVVPSFSEGLPLVALESLANATPLLITKASNVPEVSEYNCGIELEENSVETLVKGIAKMLESNLETMGANARTLAENKFQWPTVAEALYKEYEKLLLSNGTSLRN